ncbi:PREDICTED: uncharacterized protein LOC105450352 [Wasmannia auropunctata]|uniref:uncharacterized protein LOC105450352 n=1 Tax=Wasmannia auropunctata TaxID=64793 RepID=UPI0005F06CD0|nr:PREDICTED: uncharacterized protein LOC105450352 [Wasmannia auropunctata]
MSRWDVFERRYRDFDFRPSDEVQDVVRVLVDGGTTADDHEPWERRRRVSPVRFLCDRELGARGTGERAARQGVAVQRDYRTRTLTTLSQLSEEESVDTVELRSRFAILKDKTCELEELDQQILHAMQDAADTSENDIIKEIEHADEYHIKYQRMKKLQKFSGDLKEWLQFWSLFKNIHKDGSITKKDKFQYLVQAMVKDSRASELVNSFPPTAENYDKAIDSLKARFGKNELLIELYICELLKVVLNNTAKAESKMPIGSLYDKLETHLRALKSLNVTTEMCAAMLYPLVESALPEDLLRAWQKHSTTLVSKENKEKKRKQKLEGSEIPSTAGLINAKPLRVIECIFCNEKHDSSQCDKAKIMSLEERQQVIKTKSACFNCLKVGHSFKKCHYKEKCPWCGRQHVLLMCRNITTNPKAKESNDSEVKKENKIEGRNLASLSKNPEVFLQTLRVCLVNNGVELQVHAVIDTGSHHSYIKDRVAKKLRYEPVGKRTMVHLLFGGEQTRPQEHQCYNVHLRSLDGSYNCKFLVYQQDTICQSISTVSRGPWINELKEKSATLSDFGHEKLPISVLIGADIVGKLYTGRILNLKCGVTAVKTRLGWTLLGQTPQFKKQNPGTALTVLSLYTQEADLIELWNLDIIGIEDLILKLTMEEHLQEVLNRFRDTISTDKTGRYEVSLPWKKDHPLLCDNREIAERRLGNTLAKLNKDGLRYAYEKVFDEWLQEGIIEQVLTEETNFGYYRPPTGKDKPSLNQCLEAGPNFIELITTLIFCFRENQFGAIADIRKAFLQISIATEERNYLRFLWQRTSDNRLETYRHCRVVFGVTSSPFLLGATIDYHLEQAMEKALNENERSIIEKLRKSFYVNNCVASVETEEEMNKFRAVATSVMNNGGFDLRGWEFSEKCDLLAETSVLRLTWNKQEDVLMLSRVTSWKIPEKITQREILSFAQRIYDPLGFVCPVTLHPKLLLRKLQENLGWDGSTNRSAISLHLFVDASQDAYAAVIFCRVETKDKEDVNFVQAKARVAPKKQITIPRLELLAAMIGTRLMRSTLAALNSQQIETD